MLCREPTLLDDMLMGFLTMVRNHTLPTTAKFHADMDL